MNEFSYNLSDYAFDFPKELIAKRTAGKGKTRILFCKRDGSERKIFPAPHILNVLKEGDCLVVNNTKVFPARLYGETLHGGKAEVLLVRQLQSSEKNNARFEAWVKPGRAFYPGKELYIAGIKTLTESIAEDGARILRFNSSPIELEEVMKQKGHIPLPPYIDREDDEDDKIAYQTIFAKNIGAVAAPTASLHFSEQMIADLKNLGVKIAEVTLHVGPGTFQNIAVEDFRNHNMHSEFFSLSEEAAETINQTKRLGGRIVAVGTTSTRVLETVADEAGVLAPCEGTTRAFIYPGYRYKIIDGLLTNFHWPKSSLILLVSAFYGRENTLAAYAEAIQNKMKLFSYGDGMLIL